MKRIAMLDGWRGIAILLVLLNHATFATRFYPHVWAQQGWTGVDIFFVLSGYIITARLLCEGDHINLADFYRRRAVRILPPVLLYLSCIALLARIGTLHEVSVSELLGSLFLFRNYQFAAHSLNPYTAHFWSLSIEEQFYLFWPGLLVLLRPRRALYAAAIGAPLCALWRAHCYTTQPPGTTSALFIAVRTDCRLDGLLIGCALALILRHEPVRAWLKKNLPKETPLLCGFPILLIVGHSEGLPSIWLYLLIALAITSTLLVHEGLAYKWLNFKPLVWLGRISYGLYVYQELFLLHPLHAIDLPHLQSFPINLCASLLVATASFYFLEQPLSRLVHRSSPQPTRILSDEHETHLAPVPLPAYAETDIAPQT